MSIIVNDFPKNAEYWRTVDGFPAYEVSTDGRVRTIKSGRMRKFQVEKNGHVRVGLSKDNKESRHYVHVLVATAFCNRDENCNIVDHINQNPVNNNYQNLRWTTPSGNGRNRSNNKNNTSGHQGVKYDKNGSWVATWSDQNMKQQQIYFNVKKYGDETAKQMAIDLRRQMAEENGYLNV